ncbi:ABC transporter ATP-binding protein [Paenibacillus urinalis]|uniref:Energy-coupling factor transporter ATPase n=1 Tax=Paenibacillus urinalis TaxID=521520 RepID=A0AAX3N099_9BACL|nr:energy-coupling factor transporter ATPase [Paenibacillus urinalis]WDH83180.1 energy-coupling factor transporter ATPase [Paenibacillus urinalis]
MEDAHNNLMIHKPMVEFKNVSYQYEGEASPVLKGLSFSISQGERVALIGGSGSGKSTVCQLLNGYLPRSGGGKRTGELRVRGLDPAVASIADIAAVCGLVFQDPDAQLVQGIVEDEVAFGPENLCLAPELLEQRVSDALSAVSLVEKRFDEVSRLSGGQKQRTAISSILALAPEVLVFDDATASLDPPAQRRLVQLCSALHEQGRTLITASGRFDDHALQASRVIVLDGGAVRFAGTPQELLREHAAELAALGLTPPPRGEAPGREARAQGQPPLLAARGLTFTYPAGRKALQEVNGTLSAGQWTLLTGENGSGKTTLSRLMMGLLPVPKRSLYFQGRDIAELKVHQLSREMGYVVQQPEHQFVASTVREECIYGIRGALSLKPEDVIPEAHAEAAMDLLKVTGLIGKKNASPYLLSGGEKKLLSVIAQLVVPKQLYILDEPTAGLDYAMIEALIQLCRQKVDERAAILMITHDTELLAAHADQIWHLADGRLDVQK